MNILVTGGLGYIGSHTCIELLNDGYNVYIIDNLNNSCIDNLLKIEKITNKKPKFFNFDLTIIDNFRVLDDFHFNYIIHFAAYKNVSESLIKVIDYYNNNVVSLLNILKYFENRCKNLIFSSSCTIYGNIESIPINEIEVDRLGNLFTLKSPYGTTKMMCEKILYDLVKYNSSWNIVSLRYFNPVGCHPSGIIGEDFKCNKQFTNLFPSILSGVYHSNKIKIYGNNYPTIDGTCVRDYIHVVDVARAHVNALKSISDNILTSEKYKVYNIGLGKGISVLEIIQEFLKYGLKVEYEIVEKREGDIGIVFADSTKINTELKWTHIYNLSDMILHTINYYNKNK
jgi:UDP-glucose 4-epimerase